MSCTLPFVAFPVCVCVCVGRLKRRKTCIILQGRVALMSYHTQRSCGHEWEARFGQSCVPAFRCFCFCFLLKTLLFTIPWNIHYHELGTERAISPVKVCNLWWMSDKVPQGRGVDPVQLLSRRMYDSSNQRLNLHIFTGNSFK